MITIENKVLSKVKSKINLIFLFIMICNANFASETYLYFTPFQEENSNVNLSNTTLVKSTESNFKTNFYSNYNVFPELAFHIHGYWGSNEIENLKNYTDYGVNYRLDYQLLPNTKFGFSQLNSYYDDTLNKDLNYDQKNFKPYLIITPSPFQRLLINYDKTNKLFKRSSINFSYETYSTVYEIDLNKDLALSFGGKTLKARNSKSLSSYKKETLILGSTLNLSKRVYLNTLYSIATIYENRSTDLEINTLSNHLYFQLNKFIDFNFLHRTTEFKNSQIKNEKFMLYSTVKIPLIKKQSNYETRFNNARDFINNKKYNKGLKLLANLVNENPKDYRLYHEFGKYYIEKEYYEKAITNFKKSISLNMTNKASYYYITYCYIQIEEYQTAYKLLSFIHEKTKEKDLETLLFTLENLIKEN